MGVVEIMCSNKYICCFCCREIESNKLDITSIVVISNWDKDINKQQEQQLFCHIKCLQERLHDSIPLYIADLVD